MIVSNDPKVTSEILWRGALLFALIDLVFVSVLAKIVKPGDFLKMKCPGNYLRLILLFPVWISC